MPLEQLLLHSHRYLSFEEVMHVQFLDRGPSRGLHGPGPGRQMRDDFSNGPGRPGPVNERGFFQRAGPGRQMKGDFSNGPKF